jgi:hypothetical protein
LRLKRKGEKAADDEQGKYWERKMDQQREDEKVGCLRWLYMIC